MKIMNMALLVFIGFQMLSFDVEAACGSGGFTWRKDVNSNCTTVTGKVAELKTNVAAVKSKLDNVFTRIDKLPTFVQEKLGVELPEEAIETIKGAFSSFKQIIENRGDEYDKFAEDIDNQCSDFRGELKELFGNFNQALDSQVASQIQVNGGYLDFKANITKLNDVIDLVPCQALYAPFVAFVGNFSVENMNNYLYDYNSLWRELEPLILEEVSDNVVWEVSFASIDGPPLMTGHDAGDEPIIVTEDFSRTILLNRSEQEQCHAFATLSMKRLKLRKRLSKIGYLFLIISKVTAPTPTNTKGLGAIVNFNWVTPKPGPMGLGLHGYGSVKIEQTDIKEFVSVITGMFAEVMLGATGYVTKRTDHCIVLANQHLLEQLQFALFDRLKAEQTMQHNELMVEVCSMKRYSGKVCSQYNPNL